MRSRSRNTRPAIGAIGFGAVGVNRQGVVGNCKTLGTGHSMLAVFNFGVVELFNNAAIQTHQMVMVLAFIELVHRLARLKVAAVQQARLFKLGQHPVDSGQANVGAVFQQHPEYVFSRHVALLARLENFQYFQARQRGLQACIFKLDDGAHEVFP